jgi:hypothetical protein
MLGGKSFVILEASTTQKEYEMFHLYINGKFHKAYKTHGAAQAAFAKMYAIRGHAKWEIVEVA